DRLAESSRGEPSTGSILRGEDRGRWESRHRGRGIFRLRVEGRAALMRVWNIVRGQAAVLLSLACCVAVAARVQDPPVEVVGQFPPGKLDDQGRPGVPTLRAKDMTYEITFGQPAPSRQELDRFAFKMVAAKGTRARRRDASGKEHQTLKLGEKPRIVGDVN